MALDAWPILSRCVESHTPSQPLSGHAVLLIQHVLDDLVPLVEALIALGCEPDCIHIIGIPYSSLSAAANEISSLGCNVDLPTVFPFDVWVHRALEGSLQICGNRKLKLIVLEDGGYAVPALCQLSQMSSKLVEVVKGAVEQTTRGGRIDRRMEQLGVLRFPVVSIPDCETKKHIEPPYIGEAAVRNLRDLLLTIGRPREEPIRQLGIFGYGSIGDHVASAFRKDGTEVLLVDPMPEKRYAALFRKRFKELQPAEIEGCDMLLGTTGFTSIGRDVLSRTKDGVIVASASSRQIEIDVEWLFGVSGPRNQTRGRVNDCMMAIPAGRELQFPVQGGAKGVVLLYDGYPLNFWGKSLPDYVGDAILGLLLSGVLLIASGECVKPIVLPGNVALEREDLDISEAFRELKPDDGIQI